MKGLTGGVRTNSKAVIRIIPKEVARIRKQGAAVTELHGPSNTMRTAAGGHVSQAGTVAVKRGSAHVAAGFHVPVGVYRGVGAGTDDIRAVGGDITQGARRGGGNGGEVGPVIGSVGRSSGN